MSANDETKTAFHTPTPSLWILCGELDYQSLSSLMSAALTVDPDVPATLLLETVGGLAHLTLGTMRVLSRLSTLEVRAIGSVASAGVHLLQAGTLRTAYPHSQFMTHAIGVTGVDIDSASADSVAKQFNIDLGHWVDVLVRRTRKKKPAFWRTFLSKEHYFGSEEALRLGIIDRIID